MSLSREVTSYSMTTRGVIYVKVKQRSIVQLQILLETLLINFTGIYTGCHTRFMAITSRAWLTTLISDCLVKDDIIWIYSCLNRRLLLMREMSGGQMPVAVVLRDIIWISSSPSKYHPWVYSFWLRARDPSSAMTHAVITVWWELVYNRFNAPLNLHR